MPTRAQKKRKYFKDRKRAATSHDDTNKLPDVSATDVEIRPENCLEDTPQQILFKCNINQAADRKCRICDRTWYNKGIR